MIELEYSTDKEINDLVKNNNTIVLIFIIIYRYVSIIPKIIWEILKIIFEHICGSIETEIQKTVYVGCTKTNELVKTIEQLRKSGVSVGYNPRSKGIRAYPNQSNKWTVKPVQLKGSKRDVQKAIVLIRNAVGERQFSELLEEIDEPPNKEEFHFVSTISTIYVKISARKKLSIGTIKKKSFVDSIDIERTTVKASNGESYVLVNLKGTEEAIQKAISLIQQSVGVDNYEADIELATKEQESIYVKASIRRNLRIGAIKSGSYVDNINIENKRLKATSGETYVLVDILGSGEAVQKAIVLIQEQVGVDNYELDIDLRDDACENNKKKRVPNSGDEENKKQQEIRERIRNGISNRENTIRENESRNKVLEELVYPLLALGTPIVIGFLIGFGIWKVKLTKQIIESVMKAIVFIQEVGSEAMNKAVTLIQDGMDKVVHTSAYSYPTPGLSELHWLRMGCFIFALVAVHQLIVKLRLYFGLYQSKRIDQTIYVKSSQSNIITGKQGRRKKKGIINKSGVEDIQINTLSDSDDYSSIHVVGSRQSVQKAIVLIQEAVGTENVVKEYVSNDQPLVSPQTQTTATSSTPAAATEPRPNQEDHKPENRGNVHATLDDADSVIAESISLPDSDAAATQEQQSTTIQNDIMTEEATACQSSTRITTEQVKNKVTPSTLEQPQLAKDDVQSSQECTVPTEIGINSTQGMTTRETITESSISSFNDGSRASKTLSTVDMNENDPLLIFLRSQHTCIRGSVDEFYTWLVKSEFIDSMTALKESVCGDDEYYNDTMKVGSGSSGIKVFKRKAFKRALSEYEDDGSKPPTTDLNDPPAELVCPISFALMTNDPVVAADGITYERLSIEDWFKKSKAKGNVIFSPVHGTEIKSLILTPNISLRNMARAFKDKK